MLKNAFYVISALLASTAVMAQCTNNACTVANEIYKECKYSYTALRDFQKCLCTDKFLVNYNRCIGGYVCAWDGNPSTLNGVCIALYCPGKLDGGFDAKAFCSSYNPTTIITIKPSTTSTVKQSTVKLSTTTVRPTTTTIKPPTTTGPVRTIVA